MEKGRSSERVTCICITAILVVMLAIGTFCDEMLAKTLFSPGNAIATIVTTIGLYPFFGSVVLFLGVVFERVSHGTMRQLAKGALCVAAAAAALAIGFAGSSYLVDKDCLGGIMPGLEKNYVVIGAIALVCVWPLFLVGYRQATRNDDETLLKRALSLVALAVAAFLVMQATKGIFNRPRYRVVAQGLAGVNFVPWYHISPNPSDLMATHGLAKNEFTSFPSGHAILSSSTIYILLAISWLYPQLREKRVTLIVAAFVFCCVIIFSRMVLGAHYLSDVSAGALIGMLFVLLYKVIENRISASAAA